jgi:hypothetical protein
MGFSMSILNIFYQFFPYLRAFDYRRYIDSKPIVLLIDFRELGIHILLTY